MEKSETKLADIIDDMVKEAVETREVVDVRPEKMKKAYDRWKKG